MCCGYVCSMGHLPAVFVITLGDMLQQVMIVG